MPMVKQACCVLAQVCVLAAAGSVAASAQGSPSFSVLHNFSSFPQGASPRAGVIMDAEGNLYGTAAGSTASNFGVVYKVNRAGRETALYSFTGGNDGSYPFGGVTQDAAGNLYGTTEEGGAPSAYCPNGCGAVFKLDSAGHETTLYSFTGRAAGAYPWAGVTLDAAGNLYGTTTDGGIGFGVVYKVDPTGNETVLYSFTSLPDGEHPESSVILDAAGNLYGTTNGGGVAGAGVVYKLDPTGHKSTLYSFTGADGAFPVAGVVLDAAGNLYGTTQYGGLTGCSSSGCGVVYKLDPTGKETVLHSFTGGADGAGPMADVILDASGNLYGTTEVGGAANNGVVFKLDPAGQQTVLFNFPGGNGGKLPYAGVLQDASGNLYGTTYNGGEANAGIVYKLDPAGHETVLCGFPGGAGAKPYGSLVTGAQGNLYGATSNGGVRNEGAVYKMDAAGRETLLYSFTGGADGAKPEAGVILDAAGNLYGTTAGGGAGKDGVVYKVDTSGHETVLHNFTGAPDGATPYGDGVVLDAAGNLYGTTSYGGATSASCPGGCGVVYKLDPARRETVLYTFTGGADGAQPNGVTLDSAGNLYGSTYAGGTGNGGVVYKLDPTGHQTVLYTFSLGGLGETPVGNLVLDAAGNLYGVTTFGNNSNGSVYKLDATGQGTSLYNFPVSGADGANLSGGLILDAAGNLYGTTAYDGSGGGGVVFKLSPSGQLTVLHSFSGLDGWNPDAGVALDASGNLYGTTNSGGSSTYGAFMLGPGVVFKIANAVTAP
jgi:uncharacterized repeat protein (TIGR03803 family)